MAASKPTIVLIPGVCHPASYFDDVKARFEALSYEVFIRTLPSIGQAGASWADDRDAVIEMIEPHMDHGTEFVVIGHSYGGMPAVGVCEDRSIAERQAAGKRGGIRAVIFVGSALVLDRGQTALDAFGGVYPPWLPFENDGKDGLLHPKLDLAKEALYNDLDDVVASRLAGGLLPHSVASLTSIQTYAGENLQIPAFYMVCEEDNTVPPWLQHSICDGGRVRGMRKLTCATGHCPMFKNPKGFVRQIDECVRGDI
ncbi:hypothetical protein JX266_000416 [Neoarthrinium moseri]|nr:hypothetical protein JX266_000416 [Neoarthrinium moseri]